MQQVTEAVFNAIVESANTENDIRESVGLPKLEVTTKSYGALASPDTLVEYYFAGSMFGFVQGGMYYTDGLAIDVATATRAALIKTLQQLAPGTHWGEYPIGDYDQCAELGAPEILVCFGHEESDIEEGLPDPYVDMFGSPCEPSHWGIPDEAARLVQAYNKVFVSRYPNGDGPKFLASQAQSSK